MSQDEYKVAYQRERAAREAAEKMLDEKTREVSNSMSLVKAQYRELEVKNKELELLITVAKFTQEQLSLTEALSQFVNALGLASKAPYIFVYLYNEKINTIKIIEINWTRDDFGTELFEWIKLQDSGANDFVARRVVEKKDKICWSGDQKNAEERTLLMQKLKLDGCYAFPVLRYKDVVAVIEAGVEDWLSFQDTMVEHIDSIAMQLSVALERRHAQKETESNVVQLENALKNLQAAQNQLVQSEKMASLGQLAAGVAHEINNPVGFVLSNIETLKEYTQVFVKLIELFEAHSKKENVDEKEKIREKIIALKKKEDLKFILDDLDSMLEDSTNGLNRVKDIVNNLKSFARADDDKKKPNDLNACVKNTLKIVWNELKYNIEIETHYQELPLVNCNAGQIDQVLMNLLINASQACGKNGKIIISTLNKGDGVEIRIKDNGSGIESEKLSKIFDPFYTTKPVGVGTGLGLSISYGIIEKHQGKIKVESEVNKGSEFSIYLPAG